MLLAASLCQQVATTTNRPRIYVVPHIVPMTKGGGGAWKFVHFDLLNSKMQEFGLNKTICWRIGNWQLAQKEKHILRYVCTGCHQCGSRPWGSNRGNSLTCCLVEPKVLLFWIRHIKMHKFPFPFFCHRNDMLEHRAEHHENLARSADQALRADAETPKYRGLGRKNMVTYTPPMTLTFPKWPFRADFKKA